MQVVVHHLSTPSCCQQRKRADPKARPRRWVGSVAEISSADELNRSVPDHSLVIQFSD
jgi:hypothetical protein